MLSELTDIVYIKKLLSKFGFSFSKQMGQNFLINPEVCPNMAQLCGCGGCSVIEIGPGIGVLTKELAKTAKRVVAIELDKRLEPILSVTLKDCDNVEVIFGDVMKTDIAKIISDKFENEDTVICANLPYYITSPVIMLLLEQKLPVKSITVMVQKEAAQRICAEVGSRQSGAVTVAVNYYATAETLFEVNRTSFLPAPNVDSAVIKLTLRDKPPVELINEASFFKTVKAAFSQRRKTLANSLSSGLNKNKQEISELLLSCGIPEQIRAEKLSLEQFAKIANAVSREENR